MPLLTPASFFDGVIEKIRCEKIITEQLYNVLAERAYQKAIYKRLLPRLDLTALAQKETMPRGQ